MTLSQKVERIGACLRSEGIAFTKCDAAAMAHELSRTMSELKSVTIDRPASEARVAGRRFTRVDFSCLGLSAR
jgi:hypothetical protein